MEETIDLREYFFILKKKMWLIGLSAIICGLISGLVSFFVLKPVYEANTSLIVNKEVEDETTQMATTDDLNYVQKLAITYGEIIKSRTVITSTIEKLKLDTTYEELVGAVSVSNVADTQIIKISVQDNNPVIAAKICNTIPQIFTKELQRTVEVSGVKVIDKAIVPKNPIKPNKTMNLAIAMVLGVMASVFIIFLIEALDNKIKKPEDIQESIGIPVLGTVYEYETNNKKKSKKKIA